MNIIWKDVEFSRNCHKQSFFIITHLLVLYIFTINPQFLFFFCLLLIIFPPKSNVIFNNKKKKNLYFICYMTWIEFMICVSNVTVVQKMQSVGTSKGKKKLSPFFPSIGIIVGYNKTVRLYRCTKRKFKLFCLFLLKHLVLYLLTHTHKYHTQPPDFFIYINYY
jgi:hypothetical protein